MTVSNLTGVVARHFFRWIYVLVFISLILVGILIFAVAIFSTCKLDCFQKE